LKDRRYFPIGVTRVSFAVASTGPVSFSAVTLIVLNFRILNSFCPSVILVCLYKIGPGEVSLTSMAVINKIGEVIITKIIKIIKSINLFIKFIYDVIIIYFRSTIFLFIILL